MTITKKNKYGSRYKTINKSKKQYKYTKKQDIQKHNSSTNKQKTLRIIFEHSPSLENDATIYKNEFLKQGYKVDFKLIDSIFNTKENSNQYYDVNLFLETLPFKCKKLFPSKTNLFMPNNELFIDTIEDNKKYGKGYTYNR